MTEQQKSYEQARWLLIGQANELDPATLDAEACAAGPGKYEGADDLALVVALDIIVGHGFADEQAGDVDTIGQHVARVDRFLLLTDSQGFVTAEACETVTDAAHAIERVREYESDGGSDV